MKHISTSIEIDATAESVWSVLTDFPGYSDWNPFIRSISGELQVGERLTIEVQPHGQRAMTFRPRLLLVEKNREFRWLGRLLIPGIFDGNHRFEILPRDARRVCFTQSEDFSGILRNGYRLSD